MHGSGAGSVSLFGHTKRRKKAHNPTAGGAAPVEQEEERRARTFCSRGSVFECSMLFCDILLTLEIGIAGTEPRRSSRYYSRSGSGSG